MRLARLTNEIVDQRLVDRNIKRLDDCSKSKDKIHFQCLVENCDYVWITTFDTIFNRGRGCPKCAGVARRTNETIDLALIDRDIKRVDDYINGKTKIHFQCLIDECNYVWLAKPDKVLNQTTGCPRCSNHLPLSNNILDKRLEGRTIKRIGDFVNSSTGIEFQCSIDDCAHIWITCPGDILHQMTGCPKCAGNIKLTDNDVDTRLNGRNIRRLDKYTNIDDKNRFECLIEGCGHIWMTSTDSVLNGGVGCPKCSRNAPLTNEIVDARLLDKNIKRLDDYINTATPISFQCLNEKCNHIWKAIPNDILNHSTGCPNCSARKNEKLVYDTLKNKGVKVERQVNISKIITGEQRRILVDFYVPDTNIVIEYNGRQHYEPVRFGGISAQRANVNFENQIERDQYLQKFCDDNNIKLIWIDGRLLTDQKLEEYVITNLISEIDGANNGTH